MQDEPVRPGTVPRQGGPPGRPDPEPRGEREVETETVTSTVQPRPTVIPEAEPEGEEQADPNPQPTERPPGPMVEVEGEQVQIPGAAAPGEALRAPGPTHGRPKTWVILVAVAMGLSLLAYGATYTPLFAADTVGVEGVHHLTARQVRRIAKIEPGVNVFRLDTGQAERRLERNAWVADAVITTELPSAVTIVVRERTPAAVAVTDAAGGRSLVAGDGTILGDAPDPVPLPVVESADGGTVPDDSQRAVGATVAGSLPPSIVGEVETVSVGYDGSVELALSSGELVSYGDASALAAKGQALRAVLLWAEREGVRFVSVDVRTPGAPTGSLNGGATVAPRI